MPTSKRPASVRSIPPPKKKLRLSNKTGKGKPTTFQKQTQVVDDGDSVSQEELLDETQPDAQPSAGHALGTPDGNTLSIKIRFNR